MAPRTFPALALLCLTAAGLVAQTAGPAGTASDLAETPKRARVVSAGVASALAAGMPKYDPPKPVEEKAEEDLPDLREIDKPRNQIIRLPDYVVREKKPPVFRERDINTTKGLAELARKRYVTESVQALNRYRLPLFGQGLEAYTLMMYAEDERLDNITSLKAIAADLKALDPGQGEAIIEETNRTYLRTDGFGYRKPR